MRSVRKRKSEDQRETEQVEKEKGGAIANLDIKDMAMEAVGLSPNIRIFTSTEGTKPHQAQGEECREEDHVLELVVKEGEGRRQHGIPGNGRKRRRKGQFYEC